LAGLQLLNTLRAAGCEEATAVYREMAAASPGRYRANLTRSLARLARIYEELAHLAAKWSPATANRARQGVRSAGVEMPADLGVDRDQRVPALRGTAGFDPAAP